MDEARINFGELPWEELTGLRSKVVVRGAKKLRFVEFTSEFEEHDWCRKSHAGYVLDGELSIAFPDRVERFTAGDGLIISGGEREPHRAKTGAAGARLILVEDVDGLD